MIAIRYRYAQTAQRLASKLKVGRATIERDAKFATAVDKVAEVARTLGVSRAALYGGLAKAGVPLG